MTVLLKQVLKGSLAKRLWKHYQYVCGQREENQKIKVRII